MARPEKELSSIDFASLIGGPLVACVNAQTQAAMATANFIKQVGFEKEEEEQKLTQQGVGQPVYVRFKYPKEIAPFSPEQKGQVIGVSIDTHGTGYTMGTKINLDQQGVPSGETGGTGAELNIDAVDENGVIQSVSIVDPGDAYTADFQITDPNPAPGGTAAKFNVTVQPHRDERPARFQEMKLEVPFLTMLPIPYIRIEDININFNAKINAMTEIETDSTIDAGGDIDAGVGGWIPYTPLLGTAKFKASMSYKKNTTTGYSVERDYSMSVTVHAVQEEMPAGMERLLGILEDSIKAQPLSAPDPVNVDSP